MEDEEKNQQKFDFNLSMTDLMTSLMIIFILFLVVTLYDVKNKGENVRDRMVIDLASKMSDIKTNNVLEDLKLKVIKDKKDALSFFIIIDEQSGLKFASNKSDIMPQSKEKLKYIYTELLDYVCKPENKKDIDSIQIIGYTDKQPVLSDPKFGNLSLSQDRALSVLKYGLDFVGLDTDKGKCLQDLASINGRGMAELKPTDAESRRVEFKIRLRSYEQGKND